MGNERVKLGCEELADRAPSWLRSARLGLLANQASVASSFEHVRSLIQKAGGRLTCLFAPQHGFHAEKQANMIESSDDWDGALSVPIFSLYGATREPAAEMLEQIDVLIIDLQDVGTRVYTFGTTMGLCIEAAARSGVKVVILDRPNPLCGSEVEGNVLREDHRSFVGRYPIPIRHGLTMGELARFIVLTCSISCDLEVIPMQGWHRSDYFPGTHLPWVFPSPNMPSWETALLYPGMVLMEGANMSEGRGTTLPFQLFGAPFLDQKQLIPFLDKVGLDGVKLRPVCFEPVFDKWKGELCYGFQIHITDPQAVKPYRLGLTLLQAFCHVHREHFRWLPPPYEYEWQKLPIDILIGDTEVRQRLEEGSTMEDLEEGWAKDFQRYMDVRELCLLYGD